MVILVKQGHFKLYNRETKSKMLCKKFDPKSRMVFKCLGINSKQHIYQCFVNEGLKKPREICANPRTDKDEIITYLPSC